MSLPASAVAGTAASAALVPHTDILGEQLHGITIGVVMCSFAGATLFILMKQADTVWRQALYFTVSFISGLYCAGFACDLLERLLGTEVPAPVGALVASTVAITALSKLLEYVKVKGVQKA